MKIFFEKDGKTGYMKVYRCCGSVGGVSIAWISLVLSALVLSLSAFKSN
jgi:hypothetical protein